MSDTAILSMPAVEEKGQAGTEDALSAYPILVAHNEHFVGLQGTVMRLPVRLVGILLRVIAQDEVDELASLCEVVLEGQFLRLLRRVVKVGLGGVWKEQVR